MKDTSGKLKKSRFELPDPENPRKGPKMAEKWQLKNFDPRIVWPGPLFLCLSVCLSVRNRQGYSPLGEVFFEAVFFSV